MDSPPEAQPNFSRAAKYSAGKHKILQHRNSIFSGKAIFRIPDGYFYSLDVRTNQSQDKTYLNSIDIAHMVKLETDKIKKVFSYQGKRTASAVKKEKR